MPDSPGNQSRVLRGATNCAVDVFTDQVDRSIRDAELELYFRKPRPEFGKGGDQNTACSGASGIDPQTTAGPGLRPTQRRFDLIQLGQEMTRPLVIGSAVARDVDASRRPFEQLHP